MELQRIIEDSSLSAEAKMILLTAEIEQRIRSASAKEVEVKLSDKWHIAPNLTNHPLASVSHWRRGSSGIQAGKTA